MHLGSVLLCALAIVAGEAIGVVASRLEGESCRQGWRLVGVFFNNPCGRGQGDPFPSLQAAPAQLFPLPITESGVRSYLANYCSVAMPEVRRCFADQLRQCDADQQTYLNTLALNTGVICAANSTDLSAWINHLLSRLTDKDVAPTDHCIHDDRVLFPSCRGEAAEVSGLLRDPSLRTAPVADLLPVINSFFSALMRCKIQRVRDDPNRCPDWRMRALELAVTLTGPPPLGLIFTPTEPQTTELFELN